MSRLRAGEGVALVGAVALFVLLFLPWFELQTPPRVERSGWASLGVPTLAASAVAMACAAWLAVATARRDAVAQAVMAAVLSAVAGGIALVALVVRVAIAQPGLGAGAPDQLVDVRIAAHLGLVACLAIAGGGWRAMADERTDAPESAYVPPAPRAAPPPA